jgi:N-glycosylase/DNA lyase
MAQLFGKEIDSEDKTYFSFPDASAISCSGGHAITSCKLGYRAPYVLDTACKIADLKNWESSISSLPYEDARRQMMKLSGVGPKAADCILLFAFQKYEAFPVDVWIRRIMRPNYLKNLTASSALTTGEYDEIRRFAKKHFGEYCGYAQEYLYAARQE